MLDFPYMRLLYLSCHAVLEYDELKLFHEIGLDFFSTGSYRIPRLPADPIRPPLDIAADESLISMVTQPDDLSPELVNAFDVVMVMHRPTWIEANWENIRKKVVILRTIGQSNIYTERSIRRFRKKGLRIVRYSPRERRIPGYAGEDAQIRFYKDPDEYGPWIGNEIAILTANQYIKKRARENNYKLYEKVTNGLPRRLLGPGNEDIPNACGKVSYEQLKQQMRDCRAYFCTGTKPASYTLNFIEALMTGIPVVAAGSRHGKIHTFGGWWPFGEDVYEVPDILSDGAGFSSDSVDELRDCIKLLLRDNGVAAALGQQGRRRAIELFGKERIKELWREFFSTL